MKKILLLTLCSVSAAFSRLTTSLLDGVVTDPSGSLIVGAEVTVTNADNGRLCAR
jgi:hypothetical protein